MITRSTFSNIAILFYYQAQDRCYRFGQTKHVNVYRLVAQGSIEEIVYMRQLYKQTLKNAAIGGAVDEEELAQFEGIQGEVKGELFGLENILQYEVIFDFNMIRISNNFKNRKEVSC